ncbi:MAG: metallophosphoesterase [Paludibacter sp.]|nr:metallophosphoesterase [Paludibacter sp.]
MKKNLFLIITLILFVSSSFAFSAKLFKFAFFTDLHISVLKPQNAEDLENAVKDLNMQKNIDFVLVAGDDTDLGDSVSFKITKQILDKLKIPYFISIGNHDTNSGGTESIYFNAVFGSDTFSFKHNEYQFIGFPTSPLDKKSKAHITGKDLKFIKSKLKENGKKNPVFLMTHYPMLDGDVDNWGDLYKILRKYNIKAILGGHYHRNVILNYDEIPGIVNRSTLRAKDIVGGYSIYSVSDSLKVSEKLIGQPEKTWLTLPLNN